MISLILAATLMSAAPVAHGAPDRLAPEPIKTSTFATAAAAPLLQGVAVTLECTATPAGRVADCFVLAETHPGMGFGEAAVALMRDAEVEPVREPIQFARTIQFTP